jgi:hypothetical protein
MLAIVLHIVHEVGTIGSRDPLTDSTRRFNGDAVTGVLGSRSQGPQPIPALGQQGFPGGLVKSVSISSSGEQGEQTVSNDLARFLERRAGRVAKGIKGLLAYDAEGAHGAYRNLWCHEDPILVVDRRKEASGGTSSHE